MIGGNELKDTTNKFYVYLLLDPRKFYLPFYIGKGCGYRAKMHLYNIASIQSENIIKKNTIAAIRKLGLEPVIFIWEDGLSNQNALHLEEMLIERFGRRGIEPNGILSNRQIGLNPPVFYGKDHHSQKEGYVHPNQGKHLSDDTKRKIGEANAVANLGNKPWNTGKKLPPSWNAGSKGLTSANKTSFKPGQIPHNKGQAHSAEQIINLKNAWEKRKERGDVHWSKRPENKEKVLALRTCQSNTKEVVIDGKIYPSVAEANRQTGISRTTIRKKYLSKAR